MAWQSPTSKPASLALPWCPCNEASFASIIPANQPAKIEAALLAEQKYAGFLPQSHGSFFHAKESSCTNADTSSSSGSVSEAEDIDWKSCESHYALNVDDLSSVTSPPMFRMGNGALKANKEDSDVDFRTGCPSRPSQQVMPVHCGFTFGSSGVCLIKSLSSSRPTIIFIGNEPVTLALGETHVLHYRTNRFMIGKLEYNFVYNKLGDDGYATFVHQRNTLFKSLGMPLPDPRLWDLPTAGERRVIGPAIIQACTGRAASRGNLVGIHLRTGEPLAIKALTIGEGQKRDNILVELSILLSFQGARGLLQALEVRCTHGHRINHKSVQKQKGAVRQFCTAEEDTVYVITSLAHADFCTFGWAKWAEKGIEVKVSLLRDILEGVKTLHDAGYMHRNISERSLLIASENPPVALLGNYGQSILAKTSGDERIGPAHIRAPELGSTAYSNSIDIWNLGFVALSMLFPMTYDMVFNFGGTQEEIWYNQMDQELDGFMIQGETEASMARVIRSMLDDDPHKRPSAAQALAFLPEYTQGETASVKSLANIESTSGALNKRKLATFPLDGPSTKLQKRNGDREVASSDYGDDNGESVDSNDYDTDDEERFEEAFKAMRRLPSDGDLRDLLMALPAGVALPDLMARCSGKDALRIKDMIRQGKEGHAGVLIPIPCHRRHLSKLRKCFGLEKLSGSDDDESGPNEVAGVEESGPNEVAEAGIEKSKEEEETEVGKISSEESEEE